MVLVAWRQQRTTRLPPVTITILVILEVQNKCVMDSLLWCNFLVCGIREWIAMINACISPVSLARGPT